MTASRTAHGTTDVACRRARLRCPTGLEEAVDCKLLSWPAIASQCRTAWSSLLRIVHVVQRAVRPTLLVALLAPSAAGAQAPLPRPPEVRAFEARAGERIRGVIVPRQQATIAASQLATITRIGPEAGERFFQGDTLVAFDCGIYQAELKRAQALAEAAGDTFDVRRALAAGGSISRLQATLAEAELKKARADVFVALERVSYCVIKAPFAGRVVRRIANAYETVAQRDPLLELIDDSRLEVRVFVPSRWIGDLAPGMAFGFEVEETGGRIEARILTLGATIDNVSQLLEVRGEITTPGPPILAGMSGRALFAGEAVAEPGRQPTSAR